MVVGQEDDTQDNPNKDLCSQTYLLPPTTISPPDPPTVLGPTTISQMDQGGGTYETALA